MFLDLLSSFFIYPTHYGYCYAPKHQGKFLLCENLLGNKPDSDSVSEYVLSFLSHQDKRAELCSMFSRLSFSVHIRNFSAMVSAFYFVLWDNGNLLGSYNVIIGNTIGHRGSISMRHIAVPLSIHLDVLTSIILVKCWVKLSHTHQPHSTFLSSFGACKYESYWGSLRIILSADMELETGVILLSSKATLSGAKQSIFEPREKCCLICKLPLN